MGFPFDWQTCIALLIVAFAALALLRRVMGLHRKSDLACGSCGSCANGDSNGSIRQIELIQLEKKTVD